MSILKIEDDENICVTAMKRYVAFHEGLSAQTASLSAKYFAEEARYQAPMHDLQGHKTIAAFWTTHRESYDTHIVKIRHVSWDQDGQIAYVRWDLLGSKQGKKVNISGMSEITFNLKGLIISHIDYYDPLRAYLYNVPIIGALLKSRHKQTK